MKKQIAGKSRSNFFRLSLFFAGEWWEMLDSCIHVGKWWEMDRGFLVDVLSCRMMEIYLKMILLQQGRKTPFLSQEAENSPHQGDRATITAIIGDDFHVS